MIYYWIENPGEISKQKGRIFQKINRYVFLLKFLDNSDEYSDYYAVGKLYQIIFDKGFVT